MDDTGLIEYPVLFLAFNKLAVNHNQYEIIEDAATFILKVKQSRFTHSENGHI